MTRKLYIYFTDFFTDKFWVSCSLPFCPKPVCSGVEGLKVKQKNVYLSFSPVERQWKEVLCNGDLKDQTNYQQQQQLQLYHHHHHYHLFYLSDFCILAEEHVISTLVAHINLHTCMPSLPQSCSLIALCPFLSFKPQVSVSDWLIAEVFAVVSMCMCMVGRGEKCVGVSLSVASIQLSARLCIYYLNIERRREQAYT